MQRARVILLDEATASLDDAALAAVDGALGELPSTPPLCVLPHPSRPLSPCLPFSIVRRVCGRRDDPASRAPDRRRRARRPRAGDGGGAHRAGRHAAGAPRGRNGRLRAAGEAGRAPPRLRRWKPAPAWQRPIDDLYAQPYSLACPYCYSSACSGLRLRVRRDGCELLRGGGRRELCCSMKLRFYQAVSGAALVPARAAGALLSAYRAGPRLLENSTVH